MSSNPGLGFSFKLNKKKEKFNPPLIKAKSTNEDAAEFVTAIEGDQIESSKPVTSKGPLVIPLIQNNNWRQQAKARKEAKKIKAEEEKINEIKSEPIETEPVIKQEEISLEEKAQQELLNDAREFNENFEERNRLASKKVIPLLMQNKVPDGFEEDDNFDVSARPDGPTIDDYSIVPVEEYGMALLRGMGFKPEENKTIEPIEVKMRPKGLGLGAQLPQPTTAKSSSSTTGSEKLELKVGAHVLILAQEYKNFYGTIESFDEDMYRASVRLAINNLSVDVPIFTLQLVPKEEFKREGKVLNRSSYNEYKKEKDKVENGVKESRQESREDKKSKEESSSSSHRNESSASWIYPGLRVRIIDEDFRFKKGKFHEKKVVIQEVLTPKMCNCLTDRREKLQVEAKMFETVVPREVGAEVMILKGEYKREIGRLIDRNRTKDEVTVQLISDPLIVEKFSFDDICEFVGSF